MTKMHYLTNIDLRAISSNIREMFSFINCSNMIIDRIYIKQKNIDEIIGQVDQFTIKTGIMIGNYVFHEDIILYFLIFDDRVLILNRNDLKLLCPFLTKRQNDVYFLNDQCKIDYKAIIADKFVPNNMVYKFIPHNNESKEMIKQIIKQIIQCIIYKSFVRTRIRYNESKKYIQNNITSYQKNDFIGILQFYPHVNLCFNIKDQFLYVVKSFDTNNDESMRQFCHEISFYDKIGYKHHFISKYYGKIIDKKENHIILEYIEGKTLLYLTKNSNDNNLNIEDYFRIIFQIIFSVEYIHLNKIFLRDLNPNNIMIDHNKNAILIDFDRTCQDKESSTNDIGNPCFVAPELFSTGKFSFKSDIYSLGKIINLIIKIIEKREGIDKFKYELEMLNRMYRRFTINWANLRPDINDVIIHIFMKKAINKYNKSILTMLNNLFLFRAQVIEQINEFADNDYKKLYFLTEICQKNCKFIVEYLTKSANYHCSHAQYFLGEIYYFGQYANQNINKSIFYLLLSSKQNNMKAQFLLGSIFYEGMFVNRNIDRSIQLLTLSANQGDFKSQYILGVIYYENKYITKDITKSIFFLKLSADQKYAKAQYLLGKIYYEGEGILDDISKSIHYLKLSSTQCNPYAQFLLGEIYYEGKYVPKNITQSIKYFTLASHNNYTKAHYFLGVIYYFGQDIMRDINKAIFFSL